MLAVPLAASDGMLNDIWNSDGPAGSVVLNEAIPIGVRLASSRFTVTSTGVGESADTTTLTNDRLPALNDETKFPC